MSLDPFDSGLEFLVLEGGARDAHYPLQGMRVTLGRRDSGAPADNSERISFPEPTVSGKHALLEWDARKSRYLLTHLSRTNHTLVNGKIVQQPVHIHVGDKIKMGALLIQLRKFPGRAEGPQPQKLDSGGLAVPAMFAPPGAPTLKPSVGYKLLVLNGPDAATLHPVVQETQIIQEPGSMASHDAVIGVRGVGNVRAVLLWKPPHVHVTRSDAGERPVLIDNPLAGVIRQRLPGPEFGNLLTESSLLLCGKVAIVAVETSEAENARERLLNGEIVSPLQTGLFHEGDRIWNRGEQHLLRFMAGPLKGMMLWLDPRRYENNLRIGRLGHNALVELTDRGAASVELHWREETFVLVNTDPEVGLGLNSTELGPQQEARLACGDRFRLGRTLIRYEYLPIQARIDTYSIVYGAKELPLQREDNLLGSGPTCDIRIDDPRVGPNHAKIIVGEGSLRYQHRQAGCVARILDRELRAGEEAALRVETMIELCPGVHVRLARRSTSLHMDELQESQRGIH